MLESNKTNKYTFFFIYAYCMNTRVRPEIDA